MNQKHIRWISYALLILVPCWIAPFILGNKDIMNNTLIGGAVGCLMNWYLYSVQVGGSRPSNIVNAPWPWTIQQNNKTKKSIHGKNEWFARVDSPHGNVNYHHINVNSIITGVPDPHIRLSELETILARGTAVLLKWIQNYVIFVLLFVPIAAFGNYNDKGWYGIACKMIYIGVLGIVACIGAKIGTFIFPGIGTLVGTIYGGLIGGGAVGTLYHVFR